MLRTTYPQALVVDDNDDNRQIVRLALESQNFNVVDIDDPIAAQNLLTHQTFDLLILDLQMPLLDGREILRETRPNPLHRNMKIVVLTAYHHLDTPEVEDLADYVMLKPIHPIQFAELCDRIQASHNPSTTLHGGY